MHRFAPAIEIAAWGRARRSSPCGDEGTFPVPAGGRPAAALQARPRSPAILQNRASHPAINLGTQDDELGTRDDEPRALLIELGTRDDEPRALGVEPRTWDDEPRALLIKPRTRDNELRTLGVKPRALGVEPRHLRGSLPAASRMPVQASPQARKARDQGILTLVSPWPALKSIAISLFGPPMQCRTRHCSLLLRARYRA